jgi:hypothetical protein
MSTPLEKINALIPELPKEDIEYAKKFIAERNWEYLKELTWSSFKRIQIANQKTPVPQKYANLDIDKVEELALLCNEYYYLIYPEELEPADDEEETIETF